jgi:hypothetical protein
MIQTTVFEYQDFGEPLSALGGAAARTKGIKL